MAAFQAANPGLVVTAFPTAMPAGRTLQASVAATPGAPAPNFDEAFLDPAGHVVGTRKTGPGFDRAHLMAGVFYLHYTLLAGNWGRWIMGVAALGWLLGNLIGFYLTWPSKAPYLKAWWKLWTFRLDSKIPRLFLDLHRASGLWLFVGVTVLAFTSVSMNFFDEAFTPMVQAVSPAAPSPFDAPAPRTPPVPTMTFAEARAASEARAAANGLDWRPVRLAYAPDRGLMGVSFTPGATTDYVGLGPVTYWWDAVSGRFADEDNPYADSAGRKLSRALYPLHTGQMIGLPGVLFDLVLGLATFEMCVTGAYLWLKRRGPRIASKKAAAARARERAAA